MTSRILGLAVSLSSCVALVVTCAFGCATSGKANTFEDPAITEPVGNTPPCTATSVVCGGVCPDLQIDRRNCGACGVTCEGTDACCAGTCVQAEACTFAATSMRPSSGWQSGNEFVTLRGGGFVPGMRVFIGDGRASVQVTGPGTAILLTPPGMAGTYDIRIEAAGSTTTLKDGFTYKGAGVTDKWMSVGLSSSRGLYPAVATLHDGRALISGGVNTPADPMNSALATADLFDRKTNSVSPAGLAANTASIAMPSAMPVIGTRR